MKRGEGKTLGKEGKNYGRGKGKIIWREEGKQ